MIKHNLSLLRNGMTGFYKKLVRNVPSIGIAEINVGLFSIMVVNDRGGCGLATPLKDYQCFIKDGKLLKLKNPKKHLNTGSLAQWILSENTIEASVGIAALNSTIKVDGASIAKGNAYEVILKKGFNRNVAVIGHFPGIDKYKDKFKNLWIIEKRPLQGDIPESAKDTVLSKADVVAITGTSIINHTLFSILESCRRDAYKIILGPSVPMTPLLFECGIDMLSGSIVHNIDEVRKCVLSGASFKQFKGITHINYFVR